MTKNKFSDPLAELAKKRKRNTLFKTVLIALITVLLVLGITFKGLTYITSKNGQKAYNSFEIFPMIAYIINQVDNSLAKYMQIDIKILMEYKFHIRVLKRIIV